MAKYTEGDYIDQDGAVKLLVYLLNHIKVKQDTLVFDSTPTSESQNPVTSDGIFAALLGKQNNLTFDLVPTKNSRNPVESDGIFKTIEKKQDTLTFDKVPTEGSTNPVESNGVFNALAGKQDTLTFDSIPTQNSTNPVESNGIFDALARKQDKLTFDKTPTAGSTNPVESNGVFDALARKQDTLTFDETPIANSQNPVKSGGIHTALSGKQDTLQFDNQPTQDSTKMVNSGNIYTWVLAQLAGYQYVDISISDTAPSGAPSNPSSTIYIVLVPDTATSNQNLYSEYIWVTANNDWEQLGAVSVDMNQYIRKTDIDGTSIKFNESGKLSAFINLSSYLLKTDIDGVTIKMNNAGKLYADIDLSGLLHKTDIDGVTIQLDSSGKLQAVIDLSKYALSSDIGDATLTIKQGTTTLGTFKANAKNDSTISIPEPDLSKYAMKADIGDATITLKIGDAVIDTFRTNAATDKIITFDLSAYAEKTDIGDGILTIKQGDATLGTFTANSRTNQTIEIPTSGAAEAWNDSDLVAHSKTAESAMPTTIKNGTLHYTTDNRNLYLDTNNNRIKIGDYIILDDDDARLTLQNPLEDKLYMVQSNHSLWSYKNGWWSLLSFGDILTRNVLISTFPPAVGGNLQIPDAQENNWAAHATMLQVSEKVFLTSELKFKFILSQIPSSLSPNLQIIPAIYRYTGLDAADGNYKCALVCSGKATEIATLGWYTVDYQNQIDAYLDPLEVYFMVFLHNSNGIGMPGVWGTQINDKPYPAFVHHNLGVLTEAPQTITMQSESTARIYGSLFANGTATS